MIFPSCIWDIWINPNKRNLNQRNKKSETLEKEKSEVINHFSSRNCSLIKYLCLGWRMAIFHYPFTKMKLSASYPLLSLIISFITLTKDHPPHWRQIQKKSFQNHKQSSSGAQKKSTEFTLLELEMCKHKKNTSKENKSKQKKRWERIPAEKGAPKIEKKDRRIKVRSKILHMMILGPITLKTQVSSLLSFLS